MEDTSIPPHSTGNGQSHQNPVNHTRPFFYVQPPSQQFYYQWQFNNPYGHYSAFPGQGVPFGQAYMAPYPYMPSPGYIMPHAPMQPIDYRRMFNPHPSPATDYDVRFRHQARAHRETASSQTQTEARDAVSKVMVRLDKLQVSEEASEENEQDSGVVSQTSGLFLQSGQAPSQEGQREDPDLESRLAADAKLRGELSPRSAVPFRRSTAAQCVAGSSSSCMDELVQQEVWSVGVDGVLPLDSSSCQEESDREPVEDESVHFPAPQKLRLDGDRSSCPMSDFPAKDLEQRGKVPSPEKAGATDVQEEPVLDTENLQYRILRLPCDEVTTGSILRRDAAPLWPIDAAPCEGATLPPAGYLPPSLGDSFLYSYYPSVAPERQSVLSPSLDELSSRDDMFSTDLEDVESVSGRAYVSEGMPVEVARGASDPGDEDEGDQWKEEEERPARETRLCASCGSCLNGDSGRGQSTVTGTWACPENDEEVVEDEVEEDVDCDDYDNYDESLKDACHSWEVPVRKPQRPARQTQPPCVTRQKPINAYGSEHLDPSGLEEQDQSYPRGPEFCEGNKAPTYPDKFKGQNLRSAQARSRPDKLQGGDRVATGQDNWESGGIKPRPKFWKPYSSSRGQVRPARRRGGYKTFVPQRFRRDYNDDDDEEGEFLRFHRGRGSTKRRGARY